MSDKKKKNKQTALILIITIIMIPALFFIGYFAATRGAAIYGMFTTGGYSNSIEGKAIDQGKLALANSEYEKALGSFELAINEGTKDEEVKTIVKIIESFFESKKLIEEDKLEEAKKVLDGIDEDYKKYAIKNDVEALKEEISNFEKDSIAMDEKLAVIDNLLSEGLWADSKVITDEILANKEAMSEIQKEKIDSQVKTIEGELSRLENERIAKEQAEIEVKAEKSKQVTKVEKEVKAEKSKQVTKKKAEYTWADAERNIINALGPEDGTFIYNGRTDLKVDNIGKRFYTIWKEDPNASSIADGTIATYNVYEDGTVIPYG